MNSELFDRIHEEVTSGLVDTNSVAVIATFAYQPQASLRDFWPVDVTELGGGD